MKIGEQVVPIPGISGGSKLCWTAEIIMARISWGLHSRTPGIWAPGFGLRGGKAAQSLSHKGNTMPLRVVVGG